MEMALRLGVTKLDSFTTTDPLFKDLFLSYMGVVIGGSLLQEFDQIVAQCERIKGYDLKEQQLSGYTHNRFQGFTQESADRFTEILMKDYGLRTDVKLNRHFYLQFLSRFSDKHVDFIVRKVNAAVEKIASGKVKKAKEKNTVLVELGFCRKNQISFLVGVSKRQHTFFTTFRRDSLKD